MHSVDNNLMTNMRIQWTLINWTQQVSNIQRMFDSFSLFLPSWLSWWWSSVVKISVYIRWINPLIYHIFTHNVNKWIEKQNKHKSDSYYWFSSSNIIFLVKIIYHKLHISKYSSNELSKAFVKEMCWIKRKRIKRSNKI